MTAILRGKENKPGGTKSLLKIAFRNIWRNKRRTGFCFSSVGITVLIMVVNTGLNDGMYRCIYDTVQVYHEGHVKVVSALYEADNELLPVQYPVADGKSWKELAASIRNIPGVRTVLPRISSRATLQESTIKHAILWGLDIPGEMQANHFNLADRSDGLCEGRWPDPGANECAVGIVFAKKSGLGIGDYIPLKTVSAQFSDKMWNPVITGIFDFDYFIFDEQYIVVDFERLGRLLVLDEGTQSLMIFADDEGQSGIIASAVQNLLGREDVVSDWNESYAVAQTRAEGPIYLIAFLSVLIVASFIIINTVIMIIHERIREIGIMGSLGMTRGEIVKVFFFESVFMAALGAFIGAALGGLLTAILARFPVRFGNFDSMSNTVFFQFSVVRMMQVWFMAVVTTSLCTLIPSIKSAFVEPVEALRK